MNNLLFSYSKETQVLTPWRYQDYVDGDFRGFDFYKCRENGEIIGGPPSIVTRENGSPRTTLEKYLSAKHKQPIRVYELAGLVAFAEGWLQNNTQ